MRQTIALLMAMLVPVGICPAQVASGPVGSATLSVPDAVIISVVNLDRSWREPLTLVAKVVTIRLNDAPAFSAATWLAVERSAEPPIPCQLAHEGAALKVTIPSTGAAGILRLTAGKGK